MRDDEMAVVRRAYAIQVLAAAGIEDGPLERALATTERERFLGPGPWRILRWGGTYAVTPSSDPVHLYTDDLVGIDPARGLNNGQPSFLATLIHAATVRVGDHVVHVGAGTGYYSALLSRLAGPTGRVTAIEFDAGLAARARRNLADRPGAEVICADGCAARFDPADAILVNAGTVRPADGWLDRLKDGGRLILPLTTAANFGAEDSGPRHRHGAVFVVTRGGDGFAARRLSSTRIFPCAGGRDAEGERRLVDAFARGDGSEVARLHRRDASSDEDAWLRGEGWCLTSG